MSPSRTKELRGGVITALVCLAAGCGGCPSSASHSQGELVDVGGLRLNLRCEGKGTPVVAFDSGLGADGSVWRSVQAEVARVTRACAYDRAGLGQSDPPPHPHGQQQMAKELHALLAKAGETGPYVLVGHSMGAANVRWFLQDHASDVAGMVLVDATTAESFHHNMAQVPQNEVASFWSHVRKLEGVDRESMVSGYEGLRTADRPLGDGPLAILTAAKPQPDLNARREWQGALAALSTNSVHITADASGHNIHLDQPDLVARAAVAVVRAVRDNAKLTEAQITEGSSR